MPEAQVAGEAEQDVEADGEDRVDGEFLHQAGIVGAERRGPYRHGNDHQGEEREDQRVTARELEQRHGQFSIMPRRPNSPRGRTRRITTAVR